MISRVGGVEGTDRHTQTHALIVWEVGGEWAVWRGVGEVVVVMGGRER